MSFQPSNDFQDKYALNLISGGGNNTGSADIGVAVFGDQNSQTMAPGQGNAIVMHQQTGGKRRSKKRHSKKHAKKSGKKRGKKSRKSVKRSKKSPTLNLVI